MNSFSLQILFLFFSTYLVGQTMGLMLNEQSSRDGLVLFSNNTTTYLIDNCGKIVNTWESNYKSGNGLELLPDGNLLRAGFLQGDFNAGGVSGIFELFDWEGNIIWQYRLADDKQHAHHDIKVLPNGNFLCLVWEQKSESEAKQKGRVKNGNLWIETVLEIEVLQNNQANIKWKWSAWDHLIQDVNSSLNNFGVVNKNPQLLNINYTGAAGVNDEDWLHLNSIDYNESLDQVILSSKHLSEIYIIDHSTTSAEAATSFGGIQERGGDILFRYGNPQAYNKGLSTDQTLFGQHNAHWTRYDKQNSIVCFNNEYKKSQESSIHIINEPSNGTGEYDYDSIAGFLNVVLFDEITNDFYSPILSSCQVLGNDHLLITIGSAGEIIELDKNKELIWKYTNPVNRNGGPGIQGGTPRFNELFQSIKYERTFSGFEDKILSGGNPVEVSPNDYPCDLNILNTSSAQLKIDETQITNIYVDEMSNLHFINNTSINGNLYILNALGQTVLSDSFSKDHNIYNINLQQGIFILSFIFKNQQSISKVIIVD